MNTNHYQILNWLDKRAAVGAPGSSGASGTAPRTMTGAQLGQNITQNTQQIMNQGSPAQRGQELNTFRNESRDWNNSVTGYRDAIATDNREGNGVPQSPVGAFSTAQRQMHNHLSNQAQVLGQDAPTYQAPTQPGQAPTQPGQAPSNQGQVWQQTAQGQPYQQAGNQNILRGPQNSGAGWNPTDTASIARAQGSDPGQTVLGPGQASWTPEQVARKFPGWDAQRLRSVGMNAQAQALDQANTVPNSPMQTPTPQPTPNPQFDAQAQYLGAGLGGNPTQSPYMTGFTPSPQAQAPEQNPGFYSRMTAPVRGAAQAVGNWMQNPVQTATQAFAGTPAA
jgi:hypothetical protein